MGCVEARFFVASEVEALDTIIGIIAHAHRQLVARRRRIAETMLPEVEKAVIAAEHVADLATARRARARRMRARGAQVACTAVVRALPPTERAA